MLILVDSADAVASCDQVALFAVVVVAVAIYMERDSVASILDSLT